jgi:serine/threonine protein kinase
MCAQVASGVSYLETIKLIHRDLAARNLHVGDNNEVKVANFGLSMIIEEEEYVARQGTKFPIKWNAPKAAFFGKFKTKSDVWSLGCIAIRSDHLRVGLISLLLSLFRVLVMFYA